MKKLCILPLLLILVLISFSIPVTARAVPMHIDVVSQSTNVNLNGSGKGYADIDVYDTSLSLAAMNNGNSGTAYAEVVFRPIGAKYIDIFTEGYSTGADGWAYLTLTDNTINDTLLSLDYFFFGEYSADGSAINQPQPYFGTDPFQISLLVDPSHTYTLNGFTEAHNDAAKVATTLTLHKAPEPTTLLLLFFGLAGLLGIKRKAITF